MGALSKAEIISLVLFLLFFVLLVTVLAQERETRGFWVVRGDNLLTREGLDRIIQDHLDLNLNTVFVQVNGRAQAYYPSEIVPVEAGVSSDFDPLQILIEQAKAAGLEIHAWINSYTVGPFAGVEEPDHVVNQHPEWLLVDVNGKSVLNYSAQEADAQALPALMLEPGLPEVEDFMTAMFLEVVEKYDIDGIHFDYIRYPSRIFGYHSYNVERFKAAHEGIDPVDLVKNANAMLEKLGREQYWELSGAWDQLRRDNVTALVRRIYKEAKALKPHLLVSAAVYSDLASGSAVEHRFQDWPSWLAEGIIDAVVPMAYGTNPAVVAYQIQEAVRLAGEGQFVFAGLGAHNIGDPDQMLQMIARVRSVQPDGIMLFAHHSVRDNTEYMEKLANIAFERKVPVAHGPN